MFICTYNVPQFEFHGIYSDSLEIIKTTVSGVKQCWQIVFILLLMIIVGNLITQVKELEPK